MCHEVRGAGENEGGGGRWGACELSGGGGWRSGERKGDVLIVDGSGADSCNDLICLCAWRWKDRTPPERIAPSFSVNRVNYLYNEICKVVNFSSSLFLPSQLFTLLSTFWVLSSFPCFALPEPPLSTRRKKKGFVSLAVITSINIISLHFALRPFSKCFTSQFCSLLIFPVSLPLLCPPSALLYFSHCCFGLISLLAEAYWYIPTPVPPPPLTGVWAFNIQSMPPSSEPSFSTAGFDRQVPPLPPRPYRSQRMREKDAGREEGGGRDRVHPQDSGRRADRQMGEGLWWCRRQAVESVDGLKGLPLLGTEGTGRL